MIRGAFGTAVFPTNYASQAAMKNFPNVYVFGACSPSSCGSGITRLSSGLPQVTPQSAPNGSIPAANATNYRPAYLEQYNLTVEHDFGGNVLTASYVGSLGRHLEQYFPDFNAPPPSATLNALSNKDLRPDYAKYPTITSVTALLSGGASSYNSFQIAFDRRMKHGLTAGTNYTWAHGLDNAPETSDQTSEAVGSVPSIYSTREYSNSTLDLRNRFAFTANWKIPYGNNLRGLPGLLGKGWQLNVLQVWSSGLPFTVRNATNISNTNPGAATTDRPNRLGSANLSNPTPGQFFNISQFVTEAVGTLGNARRDSDYGPHYRHTDLSLFKDFPLYREVNLQLRAEGFNITNTTNYAAPNTTLPNLTGLTPAAALAAEQKINFGALTATSGAYTPRTVQFAAKIQF